MKWIAARVEIQAPEKVWLLDVVANAFYELGVQGVVLEGAEVNTGQEWDAAARPKRQEVAVIGYFPQTPRVQGKCQALEAAMARLARQDEAKLQVRYENLDEEDWSESWKAHFQPAKITPRLVVKPSWREYTRHDDQIVLEIDPGMAFGTGLHPTTGLSLKLLEKHLCTGDGVLDVGTGSGILSIAALKLGARMCVAIDHDELSVGIARKNLLRNHIDPARFDVLQGHLLEAVRGSFELVVANILSEVIIQLLDEIQKVLSPNGKMICSGIIAEQAVKVESKVHHIGLRVLEKARQEDWVALVVQ